MYMQIYTNDGYDISSDDGAFCNINCCWIHDIYIYKYIVFSGSTFLILKEVKENDDRIYIHL